MLLSRVERATTFNIGYLYIVRLRPITPTSKVEVKNIGRDFIRTATKLGNSTKIDHPKEYPGRTVYVIVE